MLKNEMFIEKVLHPKFDFNAEIQNFLLYFHPLKLNFNADFQKFNAVFSDKLEDLLRRSIW